MNIMKENIDLTLFSDIIGLCEAIKIRYDVNEREAKEILHDALMDDRLNLPDIVSQNYRIKRDESKHSTAPDLYDALERLLVAVYLEDCVSQEIKDIAEEALRKAEKGGE